MNLRDYLFHEEPGITLYCGDCREVLSEIHADVLLTDPPYGIAYTTGWRSPLDMARHVAGDHSTELRDFVLAWWGNEKPALVFGSWRVTKPAGTRTVLIYDKGGATGMGDLALPWKPSHEEIYVLGRGFVGSRDCGSVLQGRIQSTAYRGRFHVTEKDHRTLGALLSKCPDGIVLDPFSGCGSTLVAAKNLGRRAIGIEIEPRYCEIAVKRLRQEVLAF
jgi:DNA methylase